MIALFKNNSNFRSFLVFKAFSGIAGNIFSIFILWVIHAKFQNPMYTGLAGFMTATPAIASFAAGPLIDKFNKVYLLRITCLAQLLSVSLLLMFSASYWAGIWFFLINIFIFNLARMVSFPAGVALLPMIVSGEDLIKGNAAVKIISTIGGLGIGIALFFMMENNEGFIAVFAINAAVLLAALIVSAFMNNPKSVISDTKSNKSYFGELKSGMIFSRRGVMLHLLVALVSLNLFAEVASVNLPMFAELHANSASGYILLVVIASAGGMIGPIVSGFVGKRFGLRKIFIMGFIFSGIIRLAFVAVIAHSFIASLLLHLLFAGLVSVVGIFAQTLTQKLPPQNLVARVNTIKTSLYNIAASLGALAGGIIGTVFRSADSAFVLHGISYIVAGLLLCLSGHVKGLPKINDVKSIANNDQ
ncbi:MAG: MFS transporter [Defluviitaleaceae bacterium]|nr:MFS transporter [Defluviitaleaceae bacterium]